MYYEYWGLTKPPFDNVPDPSMYVNCHASMENAIAETLFGIEEGNECIAVIVGDVGLGKTMSLRMIIDSLDMDKYKMALITNPAMSFIQLLREIIGQLTGKQCAEKRKVDLLEIFNKLLFQTIDEGKRVLVFIDEANAIAPANLESLRLLTNMQQDQGNLFTLVLAGQIELARRLEHPKRANLFQRIGTYSTIDKIESPELLKTYVIGRIKMAGGKKRIFSDDAIDALWEHSDHGVPRLINKIAKLSLKAGETNEFTEINGKIVNLIGQRFEKLTRPAVGSRRPRKKTHETVIEAASAEPEVLEETAGTDFPEIPAESGEHAVEETPAQETVSEVVVPDVAAPEAATSGETAPDRAAQAMEPAEEMDMETSAPEEAVTDTKFREAVAEDKRDKNEVLEAVDLGEYTVEIHIPARIIEQAQSSTIDEKVKIAGAMAAQVLRKNPELVSSHRDDPVYIWGEVRKFILSKLG